MHRRVHIVRRSHYYLGIGKSSAMPMPKCNKKSPYQNLFLTVPDRGFSKEDLLRFIKAWRKDMSFVAVTREPYAKPQAGWTHHYHVGLCFRQRVCIGKLWKAANKSKLFSGLDFRTPLVAKGKSANWIFEKYFTNPSKYKSLDEHPMLVRDIPPCPPKPQVTVSARQWQDPARRAMLLDQAMAYYQWPGHR